MKTQEQFLRDMTDFLSELRFSGRNKEIKVVLKNNVISSLELLRNELQKDDVISKKLAKNMLYLFSATLTEAQYANNPEPLIDAAWDFEEKIQKIFE